MNKPWRICLVVFGVLTDAYFNGRHRAAPADPSSRSATGLQARASSPRPHLLCHVATRAGLLTRADLAESLRVNSTDVPPLVRVTVRVVSTPYCARISPRRRVSAPSRQGKPAPAGQYPSAPELVRAGESVPHRARVSPRRRTLSCPGAEVSPAPSRSVPRAVRPLPKGSRYEYGIATTRQDSTMNWQSFRDRGHRPAGRPAGACSGQPR